MPSVSAPLSEAQGLDVAQARPRAAVPLFLGAQHFMILGYRDLWGPSQGDAMGNLLESLTFLLAEVDNGKGPAGAPPIWMQLWWLPAIALLFYWLLIRPQQQDSRRRQAMIQAIKPNDHVLTAGGIYGVVTNVHREANAVTIRVDENNNTRLRVALSAVSRVLSDEPSGETPSK